MRGTRWESDARPNGCFLCGRVQEIKENRSRFAPYSVALVTHLGTAGGGSVRHTRPDLFTMPPLDEGVTKVNFYKVWRFFRLLVVYL